MSGFRFLFVVVLTFLVQTTVGQEICGNCIDDDNDGLVDCYDPDCCGTSDCDGFFFDCSQIEIEECIFVPPIAIRKLCENDVSMDTSRTQAVGDVDNDGLLNILISGLNNQGMLIVDGVTGVTEQVLSFDGESYFDSPVIVDIALYPRGKRILYFRKQPRVGFLQIWTHCLSSRFPSRFFSDQKETQGQGGHRARFVSVLPQTNGARFPKRTAPA